MKFYKSEKPPVCPISYLVEITAESVGRGKVPPRQNGSITSAFIKKDPIEARKEAFALSEGWDQLMKREYEWYDVREYHSLEQIKRKHYHNYNSYTISIYCVLRDDYELDEKRLIYQMGSIDCPNMDGLIWEYDLYERYGFLNPNYVDWQFDDKGEECRIIFTDLNIVELTDVDQPKQAPIVEIVNT